MGNTHGSHNYQKKSRPTTKSHDAEVAHPDSRKGSNSEGHGSYETLQERYAQLVREKDSEVTTHEQIVRALEESLEMNEKKAQADKSFYFILGLILGALVSTLVLLYYLNTSSLVESCDNITVSSPVTTVQAGPEPQMVRSSATTLSHNNSHNVASAFKSINLFSFSNVMYLNGAVVILLSYSFQIYKTANTSGIGLVISLVYCGIFIIAGQSLFPVESSRLVGGCYYVIASLLMGAAAMGALEATERNTLRGPFRQLAHIRSFFNVRDEEAEVAAPANIDDLMVLLRLYFKLVCVFASSGGLAAHLYGRTAFPGLLFPVFLGAFCSSVLLALCVHSVIPNEMVRFHWITFTFGLVCVYMLVNEYTAALLASDGVLRLSLILSSLNCCMPTLPVLLAQQMDIITIEKWRSFLKDIRELRHASMQSIYCACVCVLYAYLNCALLASAKSLGTWLHVPYALLTLSFMLVSLIGNHFFAFIVGLPIAVLCVSMPSILVSVQDQAVFSLLQWIGQPEHLTALLLHSVRLLCGVTGVGALLCIIVSLHIRDTQEKYYPFSRASPLGALLLCVVCVELALLEPLLVGATYHVLASLFFICSLVLLLVRPHPQRSWQVDYARPTIPKTLLVIFLSFRFAVNGSGSHVMSFTGALCMASCLFSLYFFDLIVQPMNASAQRQLRGGAPKVTSVLKTALRSAAAINIIAGVCSSVVICIIAISLQSQLLAWIGIVGVYAFFASVVLRVSQDWVSIASAVTVIGCLTIYTGMQLERLFDGSGAVFLGGGFLVQLDRAIERDFVHAIVEMVKKSLQSSYLSKVG